MPVFFLFFFFSAYTLSCSAAIQKEQNNIVVAFHEATTSYEKECAVFPESFFLFNFSLIISDERLKAEVSYLIPFASPALVGRVDFVRLFRLLGLKRKFKQAIININESKDGYTVEIKLEPLLSLATVKCSGVVNGKDKYRAMYLMEPGDPFLYEKHLHSCDLIARALHDEGYVQARVDHYISRPSVGHSVDAHLALVSGKRFVVNRCSVNFYDSSGALWDAGKRLALRIERHLGRRFVNRYVSRSTLHSETERISLYLQKKGFARSRIQVSEQFEAATATVYVTFNIFIDPSQRVFVYGNEFFSIYKIRLMAAEFCKLVETIPTRFLQEDLIQAYYDNGFFEASVRVKSTQDGVAFYINEGKRSFVDEVEYQGAFHTSNEIKEKCTKRLIRHAYSKELLSSVLLELGEWYAREGFWDVEFQKHECYPQTSSHNICLKINLREGEQRILRSVKIKGAPWLENTIKLLPDKFELRGIPFDISLLSRQRSLLLEALHARGFIYAQVQHAFEKKNDGYHLLWSITDAELPVKFGKVVISGATPLKFEQILRQLPFKEGMIWDKALIDEAVWRLRDTGLFRSVSYIPHEFDKSFVQDVVLRIIPDDPLEFKLKMGMQQVGKNLVPRSSGTSYRIGAVLMYRNPFDAADLLTAEVEATRFYRTANIWYRRPWLFNLPIAGEAKGYVIRYVQPYVIGSGHTLYQAIQKGGMFNLRRNWSIGSVSWNFGVEMMETAVSSIAVQQALNVAPDVANARIPYAYSEAALFVESLDNKVDPHKGALTAITAKFMAPWHVPDTMFAKLLCEQALYIPVFRSVLAVRMRVGYIFNRSLDRIVPQERFLLGGGNSLRSYQPDLAPPLGVFINDDGKEQFVPQGGKGLLNATAELRMPVYGNFGVVLFQDIGSLITGDSFSDVVSGEHLLAASGFGLRYLTPIGPLRFDIGWKWRLYEPNETRYAAFFSIGHAF